jgi:asparagine synthase (glutamine-hydrolysing)
MDVDAIDLKYAKEVADYIKSDHTEVIVTKKDVIKAIKDVVTTLETFDITTIRASIPMYLLAKYIREHTEIKTLLTGEISDELFGYKYTDFAPSPFDFQQESIKRIDEIHMYDVLRCDRTLARHSLEARVPFGDLAFVDYVLGIDPKIKMNTYGHGKFLLRKAFDDGETLPHSILFRQKAAFSDAVGHSMVDEIKSYIDSIIEEEIYSLEKEKYEYIKPISKEAFYYRELFESIYPKREKLLVDFWMPNKEWEGCDVDDPSARVLSNYGESGC